MRFVTWNAGRGGQAALEAVVAQCEPDVLLLNEFGKALVEDPPGVTTWHRFGSGPYRSQVATFGNWHAEPLALPEIDAVDVAGYRITGPVAFDIIGVWAGYPKGASVHAAVVAAKAWHGHLDPVRVVAGDFNSGGAWTMPGDLDHRVIVEVLAAWDLDSAYHASRGCEPGNEPDWTYRSTDGQTHHIDYVFVPKMWSTSCAVVDVHGANSDHRAVLVEVTRRAKPGR